MFDINTFDVVKFDEILSRGLSYGLGNPESSMCIEAAICATLGLDHGDDPKCVASSVRSFKIKLNDCNWSNPQERAKGLRDLGLVQLGSLNVINDAKFVKYLSEDIIGILLPTLIYDIFPDNVTLKNLADICKKEKSKQSVLNLRNAADCAANATDDDAAFYAADAATDKYLNLAAKIALDILIKMKSPGIKLLGFSLD